jgi:hypothetical protein
VTPGGTRSQKIDLAFIHAGFCMFVFGFLGKTTSGPAHPCYNEFVVNVEKAEDLSIFALYG